MDSCLTAKILSFKFSSSFIGKNQAYLTASVINKNTDPLVSCEEIYRKIAGVLKEKKMQIVQECLFGSTSMQEDILKVRKKVFDAYEGHEETPVTYIQGNPLWGEGFAGVQIYAFQPCNQDDALWTIYDNTVPCGRGWKRNGITYLVLQNIHGFQKDNSLRNCRENQTARMFDCANKLLHEYGADYRNVVRTWIYVSKILEWYKEFNQVRNAKYSEFGLISSGTNGITPEQIYLPASTGIEGDNPLGAAAVMDVLAIKKGPDAQTEVVLNSGSKQRSPYRYGSAFSRSIIIREPNCDLHYISGTASIDDGGKTLFPGNSCEQIRQTFDVVDTLVKREGASLQNICQATVFLKRQEDASIYREVLQSYGLTEMPAVCVIADICRDDLLFEFDAIAALEKK